MLYATAIVIGVLLSIAAVLICVHLGLDILARRNGR